MPVDLLDLLRRDPLALLLVNNACSSTLTLTATERGRPDNAPLLSSSYNYYAVLILARFPPRELGMADGSKDEGGNDDGNARGTSVAVHDLSIRLN